MTVWSMITSQTPFYKVLHISVWMTSEVFATDERFLKEYFIVTSSWLSASMASGRFANYSRQLADAVGIKIISKS
ncbi:uncharacterized protein RHIMIDRAFT_264374 [Rhizopus microsporus ATCC 52813]|uniref:Uncharacterized protein n=1 Tax=Rhizopus microsporus ATCC 52813 TaxID=1340429 RepID=A0A2G4SK97_RHIZD|nr:uncharacterized protein RHIMIDRAFT_264374 [Rhizopus microsporus ATCC 52813]PHZ09197.1 hypothetical protein RHIMIDRAFT_264374 [Rhizopus microsporus ATCC 52813]